MPLLVADKDTLAVLIEAGYTEEGALDYIAMVNDVYYPEEEDKQNG